MNSQKFSDKAQRIIELSSVLTTVISGAMLALLVSYGSDIKQISTLVYKVEKHEQEINKLQNELIFKRLKWKVGKQYQLI